MAKTTPDELPVGRIAGAFGVRGECKCDPTSAGRTVFSAGVELHCLLDGESSLVRITSVRPHKGRLLVRIDGVDDAERAQRYAGAMLFAPRERLALERGEYFDADLIGCIVTGVDGTQYGTVDGVEHYPSSDMLVVGDRMVPMVRSIVLGVDVENRRISVDPPAELLD